MGLGFVVNNLGMEMGLVEVLKQLRAEKRKPEMNGHSFNKLSVIKMLLTTVFLVVKFHSSILQFCNCSQLSGL